VLFLDLFKTIGVLELWAASVATPMPAVQRKQPVAGGRFVATHFQDLCSPRAAGHSTEDV
jgi:hypothetical protein